MILSDRRRSLNAKLAEHVHASRLAADEQTLLETHQAREQTVLAGQKVIQEVAEKVQNAAHSRIAAVVSRCLKAVFGDRACSFRVDFRMARGKTEASLVLIDDGVEMPDPLGESSGGQIEVASLALRLVCLTLAMPKRRRLIVMDEPAKSLHGEEYRERFAALIPKLAEDMDFQIVLATGLSWLEIGEVVNLED